MDVNTKLINLDYMPVKYSLYKFEKATSYKEQLNLKYVLDLEYSIEQSVTMTITGRYKSMRVNHIAKVMMNKVTDLVGVVEILEMICKELLILQIEQEEVSV